MNRIGDALAYARASTLITRVAQGFIIVTLIAVVVALDRQDREAEQNEQITDGVALILAQTCGAATFEELQAQGLLEECRLAVAGDLPDEVPQDVPADGDALPDDPDTEPEEVTVGPTDEQIRVAVDAYFEDNPLPGEPDYQRLIEGAVANYLTVNPPEPGRPPTKGEIETAVRDALLANPPEPGPPGVDGEDGQAGVSVESAALDGCDVVFTYSNGTTSRIGPLCGKDGKDGAEGPPGPPGEQGPPGDTGLVQVVDNCPPAPQGQFVTGVDVTYDPGTSTVTVTCDSGGVLVPRR